MKKLHILIPSILLGLAALLAVRSVTGVMPLGLEAAGSAKPAGVSAQQLEQQQAALDQTEAQLAEAERFEVPALPDLPARNAATSGAARPVAFGHGAAAGPGPAPSVQSHHGPGDSGHGRSGHGHDDDHDDDDRDDDDDDRDDRGRDDDDRSGHGGDEDDDDHSDDD